jgi:hypothetical protein
VHLNIHLLAMLNIQNVQWSVASVDHLERARVGGIIVAEESAVIDREAVSPEVKLTMSTLWRRCVYTGRIGVGDHTRGSIVATKGSTSTAEM